MSAEEEVKRLQRIIDDRDTAIEILQELNSDLQRKVVALSSGERSPIYQVVHCDRDNCHRGKRRVSWVLVGKA